MMTYVSAFIFYTLAMMGVLFIGFVIYKKTFLIGKMQNSGAIKVIDSLMIAPKKMLFVVKVKNERFLIASGDSHTTFLAKLDSNVESDSELTNANIAEILKNIANNSTKQAPKEQINDSSFVNLDNINQIPQDFNDSVEFPSNTQKIDQIQRQFKTLYSRDSKTPALFSKAKNNKKQAIRKLLQELNEATAGNRGNI